MKIETQADNTTLMREKIIDKIKTCYDPEIPVNVYDLGLIYSIDVEDNNDVRIDMTLTSPNCPSIEQLPVEIEMKVNSVEGIGNVQINLVWDPPFNQGMMSDEARLALGLL